MTRPLQAYLAEFMSEEARLGSSLEMLGEPETHAQLDLRVVLEHQGRGAAGSKVYFAASRRHDVVIVLVYEAARPDFDVLLPPT